MVGKQVSFDDFTVPADAPIELMEELMKKYGGCVVKGMYTPEQTARAMSEFQPHLDAKGPAGSNQKWTGEFFPSNTRKLGGLISKSRTYACEMITNPALVQIAYDFLGLRTKHRFLSTPKWATSKPQIHVTDLLEVHPGGEAQILHRDDYGYHNSLEEATEYKKGRDTTILNFVALTKVTPENGGTQFVPFSHLWGDGVYPEDVGAPVLQASLDPGDVFMMLCSAFHGGGKNITKPGDPDSVRDVALIGFSRGNLKQEENQYIANDWEVLKTYPREVLELAGWNIQVPLGWYDHGHPLNHLGYNIADSDELFFDLDQSDEDPNALETKLKRAREAAAAAA